MAEYTFIDKLYDIFVFPIKKFFYEIERKRNLKKEEIIRSGIRREATNQLIEIYRVAISKYLLDKLGYDYMWEHFPGDIFSVEGDSDVAITVYLSDSRFNHDMAELIHWHEDDLGVQIRGIDEDINSMKQIINGLYGFN